MMLEKFLVQKSEFKKLKTKYLGRLDEDYNKPIKNKGVFNGNYIIYESNGTDIITDHLLTILMKLGHI